MLHQSRRSTQPGGDRLGHPWSNDHLFTGIPRWGYTGTHPQHHSGQSLTHPTCHVENSGCGQYLTQSTVSSLPRADPTDLPDEVLWLQGEMKVALEQLLMTKATLNSHQRELAWNTDIATCWNETQATEAIKEAEVQCEATIREEGAQCAAIIKEAEAQCAATIRGGRDPLWSCDQGGRSLLCHPSLHLGIIPWGKYA